MAFSEVYVDPSIAADSGTGTIGDPYGDLEYAIEQTTFDTTNGTRVNIKAGTDEVLAASLDVAMADTVTTPAWVATNTAYVIFQGYTAVAGDGGIGGISGGGSVAKCFDDINYDYVSFVDLHIHNFTAGCVAGDNSFQIIHCHVENINGTAIDCDLNMIVTDCYIHNVATAWLTGAEGIFKRNYFASDGREPTIGIRNSGSGIVEDNIFDVTGATHCIEVRGDCVIKNNSLYSAAGTGEGIYDAGTAGFITVENNLIEGFSGVGGVGIRITDSEYNLGRYSGNAVYDCTTAYNVTAPIIKDGGDNETLTASPFTDAAAGDFSPVDTGNVKEGGLPNVIGGGFV